MASINTAVGPDKESVYYQGSLAQMQARQFTNINRDNITFMEIIKNEPKKQSYTDTAEFDARLSKFTFLSNKFIYKKVIDDARVIPEDIVIKNRMDEYFSPRFYKNIQRLYQNAPAYFDYIFSREGIAEQRHKQYSVYIYTLCLIEYSIKYYNTDEFKLIKGYQLYYDWALPKYSEHISYIIKGPLSKSSTVKIDFKKHYSTIMNPSNVEGDLTPTLQLASLQNLDSKLTMLAKFLELQPNAFNKLKDEARIYSLVLSALRMNYYNEPTLNNTIVMDLRGADFGNVGNAISETPTLDSVIKFGTDISSRLSIHKLQELFNDYTRLRVQSFSVDMNLYKAPLDWYTQVQVYIKGVQLASRAVSLHDKGKAAEDDGVLIPGTFSLNQVRQTYDFIPSIDVITYDNKKVRVTDARIYLMHDGNPLVAYNTRTELLPETTYNVIHTFPTRTNNTQTATLYTFSKYHAQNYVYPIQEGLIDIDGYLVFMNTVQRVNRTLLNTKSDVYTINPFTLFMLTNGNFQDYRTNSWNTDSEDSFKQTLIDAGINSPNNLQNSIYIVLNTENPNTGYVYNYSADLTERLWNIDDYYRSVFAVYDPVTDEVFARTTLNDGTNGGTKNDTINGAIFTILVHDTITNENAIYTYNFNINGCTGIQVDVQTNNDTQLNIIGTYGNPPSTSTDSPTEIIPITTNSIITILTLKDKSAGFSLSNIESRRLIYSDSVNNGNSAWTIGPCLLHLPPLNKLGYLFADTITPWFDLKLRTINMDRMFIPYSITKAIPMLTLYSYTKPMMIVDGELINGNSTKLINIVDSKSRINRSGLLLDEWRSVTTINTTNFIELDLREEYAAVYDYYHAFELTLEFS